MHAVLERLFDLPAAERTLEAAATAARTAVGADPGEDEPELAALFDGDDGAALADWLAGAEDLLARWFALEDPTRLEPTDRELYVETRLDDGLLLRGYVDRLDVAADGRIRVVDYKTGRAPSEHVRGQGDVPDEVLRAGAVAAARRGCPRMLQLVYLGNGEILRYAPDEADLLATERKLKALWAAIERAAHAPATGGPRRAGCATGATTRRSARPRAACRHRCRRTPCCGWAGPAPRIRSCPGWTRTAEPRSRGWVAG